VQEVEGDIRVVLPCSHSARLGSNGTTQVDAHFVFAVFDRIHLVQNKGKKRFADHKMKNVDGREMGLCFFDCEELTVTPDPLTPKKIKYDLNGPSSGVPKPAYSHVDWIPRWSSFADKRDAKFKDLATEEIDFVGFTIPGGLISAGFVCPVTPKVAFKYGTEPARFYAHEIVVTLKYADDVSTFTLSSKPTAVASAHSKGIPRPTDLELTWGTSDEIRITIGNGSLASIESVLNGTCGHEHRGKVDYEFEIIYDVVSVNDPQDKRPVPEVGNSEIRQIPCIATMI
jgi:hypothetical protein